MDTTFDTRGVSRSGGGAGVLSGALRQQQVLMRVAGEQARTLWPRLGERAAAPLRPLPVKPPLNLWQDALEYGIDSLQRQVLFWDTMRRAGNGLLEHERRGCPPALAFDYDIVVDGRSLSRPVNYALVRIRVPDGCPPTDPVLRPFVVIDPRAGHGAGIGGFKTDSEVGVALRARHPVYFVIFFRDPEPGQTILDVTAAEREFLREVTALHPEAPKPVVLGNCQGGWAAMLLAATAPDLVGPLVLNGAPLSYWAGRTGRAAMRYIGGLVGGSWPIALLSDLGNGRFDGAHLGLNFEALSPGNTWFRKYFDIYSKVDTEAERFLEFERWWIVSEAGEPISIRSLHSPVIVFASEGDHITPPGQALRWIADVYRDEDDIKSAGQTIVYLLHDTVGHLGIFVSASVARKEHSEIASILEVIEAVAPGLYEMRITGTEVEGYQVDLQERSLADIRAISGGDAAADAFAAVADVSEAASRVYDAGVAPILRPMVTEPAAELGRGLHPLRLRRYVVSDANPALAALPALAEVARRTRQPAPPENLFRQMEQIWAQQVEHTLDTWRDLRDGATEALFFGAYGWLAAFGIGQSARETAAEIPPGARREIDTSGLATRCREGGYAEAVVRMMLLLARARGGVRRSKLERSKHLLSSQPPFAAMSETGRQTLIQTQSELVSLAPEECLASLPALLPAPKQRRRAIDVVQQVAGPTEDLDDRTNDMLLRIHRVLGLECLELAEAF
jgi:pimeloyl-ACP methyl ester carboxylesterase